MKKVFYLIPHLVLVFLLINKKIIDGKSSSDNGDQKSTSGLLGKTGKNTENRSLSSKKSFSDQPRSDQYRIEGRGNNEGDGDDPYLLESDPYSDPYSLGDKKDRGIQDMHYKIESIYSKISVEEVKEKGQKTMGLYGQSQGRVLDPHFRETLKTYNNESWRNSPLTISLVKWLESFSLSSHYFDNDKANDSRSKVYTPLILEKADQDFSLKTYRLYEEGKTYKNENNPD